MSTAAGSPPLGDRFAVERELGRGGMATVYLAQDRTLGRAVAVKVFDDQGQSEASAERFAQEVRLTARLVHPNIVPLFDSGVADGRPYYVMPFVAGETLRQRLQREGRLPVADVLRIAADVSEALAYAHGAGVVHRDLKPENIFQHAGRALLADFGIAKVVESNAGAQTITGVIVGTAAYMSPEQAAADRTIDGRSDLYALGCVLFELLSGGPPFGHGNTIAVLAQHAMAPPPALSDRSEGVPLLLCAVVTQLLSKDPVRRPASASVLLDQLRAATPYASDPVIAKPALSSPRVSARTRNPDVVALTDQARDYWTRSVHGGEGSRRKMETARELYQQAVELDGDDPIALCGLADTELTFGWRGYEPTEEAYARSRALMRRALRFGQGTSEVHLSVGVRAMYWEDDFELAGRELERSIQCDVVEPHAFRQFGNWLKMSGRTDEALAMMHEAVRRQPVPFNFVGLGDVLMATGRYDEAIAPLREALKRDASYGSALERLEIACHRAGRHDDALGARRARLARGRDGARLAKLEADVAEAGWMEARRRDAERDLAGLMARATTEDAFDESAGSRIFSDTIIILLAEQDRWTEAMDWVERGASRRPGRLRRVLTDLPYDRRGLAVDRRYAPLLRNAGLEELL